MHSHFRFHAAFNLQQSNWIFYRVGSYVNSERQSSTFLKHYRFCLLPAPGQSQLSCNCLLLLRGGHIFFRVSRTGRRASLTRDVCRWRSPARAQFSTAKWRARDAQNGRHGGCRSRLRVGRCLILLEYSASSRYSGRCSSILACQLFSRRISC